MSTTVDIVASVAIQAPRDTCFEYIVPVALAHIFHPYLFIPGVRRTDESELWVTPGLSRTVYFTDGTKATESLDTVNHPSAFSYHITHFTGVNRFLVARIEGSWQFTEAQGGTAIKWTYSLVCHNRFAARITKVFIASMLKTFLDRALQILKQDLEKEK